MRYRKPLDLCLAAAIAAAAFAMSSTEMPLTAPATVLANGFTVPLVEGDSGPYNYLVGIWPAEPVVGNLHMAIALTSEQGPVTDATVDVRGRIGRNGPLSAPVPAPGYFLQPWSYELDMSLREPGRWTFEIQIDGSQGNTVLEVPLEVAGEPREGDGLRGSADMNLILGGAVLAALILASGGWVFMQRQRAESRATGIHQTRPVRRRRR